MGRAVLWFRRDLRLSDNPALAAAVREVGADGEVVPLFCLDPRLTTASGAARLAFLAGCLGALDESIGGRLVVRRGRPAEVVAALAREVEADRVVVAEDFGPYGAARDRAVETALGRHDAGAELVRVGSPYAVPPGEIVNRSGQPYKVFTPFSRAWQAHGWPDPIAAPRSVPWASGIAGDGDALAPVPNVDAELPEPGEAAAERAARRFHDTHLADYAVGRDRPDLDATSRLSPYLKWGCLHPRQLLAQLGRGHGDEVFRTELCWREFYADVLWHRPDTVDRALAPGLRAMEVDTGPDTDEVFRAWSEGRTGYPIVDAGMRQLAAEGWMHNRMRMIVASFLVKDLHLDWTRGARWFMDQLVDGDLASNQHGWQWVAGTGTDAAPYFRIFNPVSQGERYDPRGDYVRRWVPELRGVAGKAVHQPWKLAGGVPAGYPDRIVDHADERAESLRRYAAVKRGRG
jgi:deoxyribodipyrimidine photo-lyase